MPLSQYRQIIKESNSIWENDSFLRSKGRVFNPAEMDQKEEPTSAI